MIVDANLLVYATITDSGFHEQARTWLEDVLNGAERVGLPWQSLGAFVRITTNPRIQTSPFSAAEACAHIDDWLARPPTWVPPTSERTAAILTRLLRAHGVTSDLVTDAQLAAIAIEHGVAVCSADSDFRRFGDELHWINPLMSR